MLLQLEHLLDPLLSAVDGEKRRSGRKIKSPVVQPTTCRFDRWRRIPPISTICIVFFGLLLFTSPPPSNGNTPGPSNGGKKGNRSGHGDQRGWTTDAHVHAIPSFYIHIDALTGVYTGGTGLRGGRNRQTGKGKKYRHPSRGKMRFGLVVICPAFLSA
ncbi:hypothetical protein B0T24DRAFT_295141 [Lasiosphaeria ovina]|uniref:Uncharacterized protein n=1 Tax=Lasiosphaeria ovina TaxID=92902 RepID=A0AAE0KDZ8_9PEZI|nr:hypothetical protein B0T24DRAFT_295141 [Lasiosphaeria ovina]